MITTIKNHKKKTNLHSWHFIIFRRTILLHVFNQSPCILWENTVFKWHLWIPISSFGQGFLWSQ